MEENAQMQSLGVIEEEAQNVTASITENPIIEEQATGGQTAGTQISIDPAVIEELKLNQSLIGALTGGFIGAAVGAVLWAILTAAIKYQIGYMAMGVGFITGFLVRKMGRGFEKHYGFIGAAWSLIGCLAGNLLAILIMVSQQESIPFFALLQMVRLDILFQIAIETFDARDLIFYGIAVYEGYHFSFITRR